jgi:hypothetical protein
MRKAWETGAYKALAATPKEKGPLGRREDNIKIDLKVLGLKTVNWVNLLSCELGNKPTGWIKCSKFLDSLRKLAFQEGANLRG